MKACLWNGRAGFLFCSAVGIVGWLERFTHSRIFLPSSAFGSSFGVNNQTLFIHTRQRPVSSGGGLQNSRACLLFFTHHMDLRSMTFSVLRFVAFISRWNVSHRRLRPDYSSSLKRMPIRRRSAE